MPKLTKQTVETARPDGRDRFLWDDKLPGFGLRIFASGKRSYLVQYRAAGRTRRVTIGLHGRITAEEARKEARGLLGSVAKGGNPAETRARDRAAITVSELCRLYLEAAGKGLILGKRRRPKKASTLATDRGRIERHIKPLLGTRLVVDLALPDVTRFMRAVAAGKTKADIKTGARGRAIVRGGRGTATRTVGLLGGILSFAVSEGIRPDNPARGVERFADNPRSRTLDATEYRALGKALEDAERDGESWQAIAAARLIALTGCRRGEILGLERAAADEASGCFRFADTKEGAAVRPIGTAAFDVLRPLPKSNSSPYVLPAAGTAGAYTALPKAWPRIVARARGLDGLTLHGLRHAFASTANMLGYTEATIAELLGHSTRSMTGRYTHHIDAVLKAAADRVASAIAAMMGGHKADVVRLPRDRRAKP